MRMKTKGEVLLNVIEAVKSTGHKEGLMELKDDRWLVKSVDPATVIVTAVRVPDMMLLEWDKGNLDALGLPLDAIEAFIGGNRSDEIEMWTEQTTIHMDDGNTHLRRASIDTQSVHGKTDTIPNINHEVVLRSDLDFLTDFIKKADEVIGSSHYYVGAREEGLYLFARADNGHLDRFFKWSTFDDVEINWDHNNLGPGNALIPAEDHGIDTIQGIDYTNEINTFDEKAEIRFANHHPTQIVYNLDDEDRTGMSVAYIQAPRLDEEGDSCIPEEIRRV